MSKEASNDAIDNPEMQRFQIDDSNEDLLVIELNGSKHESAKEVDDVVAGGAPGTSKVAASGDEKVAPTPAVGFGELFRFADSLDLALMTVGSVGAVVHGCSLPIFLRFFADLVDSFGSNYDDPDTMCREVVKYAFYFLVVGAAIWASSWAEISCWMWTGERQTTKMRIKYLESALSQDICYFDTEVRISDVIFAVNSDAVTVQDAISEKLGNFIHYMGTFASGFIVGFTAVWQLALVTLAVVPLIAVIGGIHQTSLSKLTTKSQDALSQASNIAEQALAQIRTVQSYVGESRALKAYSSALRVVQKIGYKTGLAKGLGLGATYFTVFCCYALLLWYGGLLVRHHHTNGGLAIATMFSVMLGGIALGQSAPSMAAFAKARVSAAKIYRIIDHKPEIERNGDSGTELESITGHVELKNVDFAYPSRPDILILNNFSLNVAAGKTMALVGSSGSGKSTVVSLIERFYDPIAGEVLLDGHDIKTMKLRWVRQQIGLVSQEPALFATTIRENLLLGREDATQVEIEEAARVANAHSFIIKLPDGYDSQVGERGLQLSGGQKQRIAIARAMLKNPAILLLDEATSALDSESEKLVQEALDRFMIGRTTLVIAHRLSTVRKADSVSVLQQGAVSETGTHDELMSKGENGLYAKLIRLQEQAHETAMINSRKSSARPSSARPSISSPIITRNSSYGRSPYSRRLSDFSTSDYGLGLSFEPNHHRMEKLAFRDQANSFWRLAKMNSPEWTYALIGSIGSMICGTISALFAYVLSAVLSIYYAQDYAYMRREIAKYCYLLIGVSSAALLFNTIQHLFWDIVGENLTRRVREKMLTAVLKNEMAWFDQEENASSRIAARLTLDAHNVRSAIGDRISVIVQNCALLLVACGAGFVLEWRLALVLMAVFPVVVAATVLQKMFMTGFSGDLEASHAKATQIAGEAVANVRTVAAFNAESRVTQLFAYNLESPLRRCLWKGQIAGSGFGIAQFLLYASYSIGLWYASYLVKHNISDFSKTIRVFMVLMVSANGAAETLTLAPDFIKGGRAMKSVFEIIDRKTEIEPDDTDAMAVPDKLRGEVELKHVDFSYPTRPDYPVLRDFTIRARAGRMLALVGPSGCGKSSVISLIQRFYEPNSGRVVIDGKDIRKYNLKALRQAIAVVPQEPCLFSTTIYENIAYGRESVTDAEVVEAATLANAHKFISALPDGYKTFVGERGVQISGGHIYFCFLLPFYSSLSYFVFFQADLLTSSAISSSQLLFPSSNYDFHFRFVTKSMASVENPMNSTVGDQLVLTYPNDDDVATGLAVYVADLSKKYTEERGAFTVVLSGGYLIACLRKLLENPYVNDVDWAKWHVFWVDERVVPKTHNDSNYKLACDGFLNKVNIPQSQIYAINDALDAEGAADDYEKCLQQLVKAGVVEVSKTTKFPRFDLMLLGMGPDGHLASLFPHHPLLKEKTRWVTYIKDSPKPPPVRITFTFPVIDASANIAMVVVGPGEVDAVKKALGPRDATSDLLPVQMVSLEDGKFTWFTDEVATSKWHQRPIS